MELITASFALPMTGGCPVIQNGTIAVFASYAVRISA